MLFRTFVGIALSASNLKVASDMRAATGQRDYVVNDEIAPQRPTTTYLADVPISSYDRFSINGLDIAFLFASAAALLVFSSFDFGVRFISIGFGILFIFIGMFLHPFGRVLDSKIASFLVILFSPFSHPLLIGAIPLSASFKDTFSILSVINTPSRTIFFFASLINLSAAGTAVFVKSITPAAIFSKVLYVLLFSTFSTSLFHINNHCTTSIIGCK